LRETFFWPKYSEITVGLLDYFKIGLPSAGMMWMDWWAWELTVMISGRFKIYE